VGAFIPGAANQVSLLRAYLGAPAFGYAVVPGLLGPLAVAVTLAGLSDLADGVIARRFERPTALGGGLDPVVDGIFYGGVAIGLAFGAAYPAWLAAVVVGRYLLPAAVGGVLLLLGWQPELRHTFFGQLCTTVIALLLGGVALFRGLGQDTGTLVAAAMLLIPATTLLAFADLARSVLRGRRSEGDVRPPPSPPTEGEVNS
jgi:cardiolipin synthase